MCDDNIKVVVKVRPLIEREINDKLPQLWSCDRHRIWPTDSNSHKDHYTFDAVFDEDSTTKNLYDEIARPIVEAAIEGINGTIFAYGQTSSGKTYTMMGTDYCSGIIPLAVNDVFKLRENKSDRDFLIRVSFIEIYNEKIKDLLDPSNSDVKIREDFNNQVYAICKEEVTTSPEDVLRIMSRGNQNRSVGETLMNERSSRSHSIFQITIESRKHTSSSSECEDSVNVSQLNLVDLAGSERANQAGTTKQRLREGCHINKSLTNLSLVIRQLSTNGDKGYINYRDSKLTRFLQSSLGGNAKTGIICTVTITSLEETDSTLKFATYAKTVQNKPIVNEIVNDATQLKILTRQLESLQKEMESKKCLEEDNQRLQQKVAELKAKILMGIGDREIEKRNLALRRRTWCGRGLLPTIDEDISQPITPLKPLLNNSSFSKLNNLRLSNITEKSESFFRDSVSSVSTPITNNRKTSDVIIELDDSDEINQNELNGSCSPTTHRCFHAPSSPPCTLRERLETLQKEYKELEEMTSAERLYKPDELEYIKQVENLKLNLQNMQDELQKTKKNETELQEKISNLVSEKEINDNLKVKLDKNAEQFQCEIEGLKYQLENTKKNHKKREEELLISLDEARNGKSIDNTNTICNKSSFRYSQIPIPSSENKRKGSFDSDRSFSVEEDPVFIEKKNELTQQISLNSKLERKIEELEYKLTLSDEKIAELSSETEKCVMLTSEIEKLKKVMIEKDEVIKRHENIIDSCTLIIEQTLTQKHYDESLIMTSEFETNIRTLLTDYINTYKNVQEYQDTCGVIKEKLVCLDNANNEMRLKLENLNDKINELRGLDLKSVSKIKLGKMEITLDRYLKNLIKATQNSVDPLKDNDNEEYESYAISDISESIIEELSNDSGCSKEFDDDLVNSIAYLEDVVDVFKSEMSQLAVEHDLKFKIEEHEKEPVIPVAYMPIFKTLHLKLESAANLNRFLLGEFLKQKRELETEKITLFNENKTLKTEIQDAFHHVRELLKECEDLYKKILHHRNEHQMSNAEITLITSQLNATNHYHNCLHNTCDSTIEYFRKQLLSLQEYLQNYVKDNDTMDLLESSYSNMFSSDVSEVSKLETDKPTPIPIDFNDIISKKQKEIETLQQTVKLLEEENGNLSDQLMEYIQESDNLNKKESSKRNDIAINTSIVDQKQCVGCSDKFSVIENNLDNLINIFILLNIEIDKNDLLNVQILNDNIKKSHILIDDLIKQHKSKNEQLDVLNGEMEKMMVATNTKNVNEKELNLKLEESNSKNSELQTSLNLLQEQIVNMNFQLNDITCKYDELVKLESTKTESEQNEQEVLNKPEEIVQLMNNIETLNEELKNKNFEFKDIVQKHEELKGELSILQAENNNLNEELNKKIDEMNKMEDELKQLKVNNEVWIENEKNIRELELKIAFKTDICSKNDILVEELRADINSLNNEILEKNRLENDLKDKICVLNDEISHLIGKIQDKNDELTSASHKNEQLESEMKCVKTENEQIKEEFSILESKLNKLVSAENESESKYEENVQLNEDINKLRSELSEKNNLCSDKESLIEELNCKINVLNDDIINRETEFKSKIADLCEEISVLKENLSAIENTKMDCDVVIKRKDVEIKNLTEEISHQNEKSEKDNRLIDDLKTKLNVAHEQLSLCKAENSSKNIEIDSLNSRISSLETSLKKSSEDEVNMKDLLNKVGVLESQLEFCKTEKSNVIETYKTELESLQKDLKCKSEEIHNLKNASQNITKDLQQSLEKFKSEKDVKDTENNNLKKENSTLQEKLENNYREYNMKVIELENIIKSNSSQNFSKETEIQKLKNQIINMNTEFNEKKYNESRINGELQYQITNYQSEINNLQHKLHQMNQKLEEYVQENEQLKFVQKNVQAYQSEISIRDNKLTSLKYQLDEVTQSAQLRIEEITEINNKLKQELADVKNENVMKENEIKQLQSELKSIILQLKSHNSLILQLQSLEKEKSILQEKFDELKKAADEKSNAQFTGFSKDFMENFVDKMTYDIAIDNNRQLQTTISDLRSKNKEFLIEIRRLQHSLQNNTLNNLLSNDGSNGDLKKKIDQLENELKEAAKKYNDLDKEYNDFLGIHQDMEKCCNEYYLENKKLKTSVANYEMELKDYKDSSHQEERRKKRQSLHDMNRRVYETQTEENVEKENKTVEKEKENFQKNICDVQVLQQLTPKQNHNFIQHSCQKCITHEHLKLEYNRLKSRYTDLELRFNTQATYHNGGIVMNQKLREYMLENERLQYANSKLKDLCRLRDQKIKELKKKEDER